MAELQLELRGEDEVWLSGDAYAEAYGRLCDPLVREGRVAHYVEVAAGDAKQLDAWYGLGFGRQQVYASRAVTAPEPYEGPVRVRDGDLETAVALGNVIREHQLGPPVWSNVPPATKAELREGWGEFLSRPETTYLVAELDGRAVAHLWLGEGNYLHIGATLPEARGRGAMRALWSAAVHRLLAAGHATCDVDWRSANIEAARCWTALGFRPVRYRLHRYVAR